MITYKDIYEISRKERFSEGLQKISMNFISEFSEYLKEKKKMASKEEDLFSDLITKTKKQIENSVLLFKELLFHRRKKILDLVLIASEVGIPKKDFNNMFDFEKKLFEDLMKEIETSNKEISHLLDGTKVPLLSSGESEETKVSPLSSGESEETKVSPLSSGESEETKVSPLSSGESDGKQGVSEEVKLILIKEDIKEFLNFEGEKKGPFKKGQILEMPKKIAEILIRDERAEVCSE